MIQFNCTGCTNNCCQNPSLTPVFLPFEEKQFKKYSRKIKTPFKDIFVMKKENNACIFLDASKKCKIHANRPIECQLYPLLLDFEASNPSVKLDKRFCPKLNTFKLNKEKIALFINSLNLPKEWINAYQFLEDY